MAEELPTPQPEHTLAQSRPPSASAPPEQFGRYRIRKQLGKGGMGAVYLADDSQLARQVALKIPRFNAADGPTLLERFYREARSAATITHPNICPVYDVGEVQGVHYLTMAYIEGRPLSAFIKSGNVLSLKQVVGVVRKLALGLQEAHHKGIIHRDLKPSNVMINTRSEPIIMDFGLARRTNDDAQLTKDGAILGTPAYMSPEQVKGDLDALGPASDIYSLGVILYELLTLRLPFEGPVMGMLARILTEEPEPPSKLRADVDPPLEAICQKAMAKKPADRYASMAEFASALTEYLKNAKAAATTTPSGGALSPPSPVPAVAASDTAKITGPTPPPLPGAGEGFPALPSVPMLAADAPRRAASKQKLWLALAASVGALALLAAAYLVDVSNFLGRSAGPKEAPKTASKETKAGPAADPKEKKPETNATKLTALLKSLKEDDDGGAAASSAKLAAQGTTAVDELRGLLKDDDARTRRRAAATLGVIGAAAAGAVADLTPLLRDTDGKVRAVVAGALGKIGPAAKPALPLLVPGLADPEEAVRDATAQALNRVGPPKKADVPFLSACLADDKAPVRRYAVEALGQVALESGDAVRLFGSALKDSDKDVRRHAARALGTVAPAAKDAALGSLLEALRDPEADVRREVLEALSRLGPPTVTQVPTLQAALKDRVPEVRRYAAQALAALGREARPALSALLDLLYDASKEVSQAAADAVVRINPVATDILPALTRALRDPSAVVRRHAAGILAMLAPQARDAVLPVLFDALQEQDVETSRVIVQGLERSGPWTRAELPFLTKTLQSNNKPARLFAVQALARMGADGRDTVFPLLLEALKDDDTDVRRAVTEGLERLGPSTKADLPLLLATLKSNRPAVRAYAVVAVGRIGPDAQEAVPLLTEALKDRDPTVPRAAAAALGTMGPAAVPAVPQLAACVRDGDRELRKQAALTLGALGPKSKAAVPALIDALKQPDKELSTVAAVALGRIGPDAKAAVPLLVVALGGEKEVRDSAVTALGKIGKYAVPALTDALKQRNAAVRLGAAVALGQIGPDAKGPAVIQLSVVFKKDAIKEVRQAAAVALESIQRKP